MSPHATTPDGPPNHQYNNGIGSNWRDEMTIYERERFVSQLEDVLKELSPVANDEDIHDAASNFENTLYQRSTNKNQYILAYAHKFNQIKYQIQLNKQNDVVPNIDSSSEQND